MFFFKALCAAQRQRRFLNDKGGSPRAPNHENRDFRDLGQDIPPMAKFACHWTAHGLKWIADSNSPRLEARFCVQNDQKCENLCFSSKPMSRKKIALNSNFLSRQARDLKIRQNESPYLKPLYHNPCDTIGTAPPVQIFEKLSKPSKENLTSFVTFGSFLIFVSFLLLMSFKVRKTTTHIVGPPKIGGNESHGSPTPF